MNRKTPPKNLTSILLKMVPYVIAIASAISAITPNHKDDELLAAFKQIVNLLALNVGHNAVAGVNQDFNANDCSSAPTKR